MSYLGSLPFGITGNPKRSYKLAAKIAPFSAPATTVGARNNPWYNNPLIPNVAPTSFPSPGAVRR